MGRLDRTDPRPFHSKVVPTLREKRRSVSACTTLVQQKVLSVVRKVATAFDNQCFDVTILQGFVGRHGFLGTGIERSAVRQRVLRRSRR